MLSDLSLGAAIILVAGGMSIFAMIISKICLLLKGSEQKDSKYESGFQSKVDANFRYCSDKSPAVAMYLVIELAVSWLMICFAYHIYDNEWNGIYFTKILSGIILISLIVSVRSLNRK